MTTKLPDDLEQRLITREPRTAVMMVDCKVCGQRFNLNNLPEAYHHNAEAHQPMAPSKR